MSRPGPVTGTTAHHRRGPVYHRRRVYRRGGTHRRRGPTAGLLALTAVVAAGCGPHPVVSTPASPDLHAVAPALPTAVTTSDATVWATLPMGHLGNPLNTFWQLLESPNGATGWTDDSTATATATNGGLILSAAGSRLSAGVIPSQGLTFSPLISSTDGGRTWTGGLLPGGLAPEPSALAVSDSGDGIALLGPSHPGNPAEVVTTPTPGLLTRWDHLVDQSALGDSLGGYQCRPTALDAVGWVGTQALVGTSCAGSTAGIFVRAANGTWSLAATDATALNGSQATQVLEVEPITTGVVALVAGDRPSSAGSDPVSVLWDRSGTPGWQAGPALALPDEDTLQSAVVGPNGAVGILERAPTGGLHLFEEQGPTGTWTPIAAPPAGTSTIAFGPSGLQALAAQGGHLRVLGLSPAGSWTVTDSLQVTIEYGSSS